MTLSNFLCEIWVKTVSLCRSLKISLNTSHPLSHSVFGMHYVVDSIAVCLYDSKHLCRIINSDSCWKMYLFFLCAKHFFFIQSILSTDWPPNHRRFLDSFHYSYFKFTGRYSLWWMFHTEMTSNLVFVINLFDSRYFVFRRHYCPASLFLYLISHCVFSHKRKTHLLFLLRRLVYMQRRIFFHNLSTNRLFLLLLLSFFTFTAYFRIWLKP